MNHSYPSPYIQISNIYMVPIFPERLSGAVLVRRAIEELKLGKRDAIAVAHPDYIKKNYLQAVRALPSTSLIYLEGQSENKSSLPNQPDIIDEDKIVKELITVTPSDGITEAILSAVEHNINPLFIDMDLSPFLQTDRSPCGPENLAVDDWICVNVDAELSVELFANHPALRHHRILPVDEWREWHIAAHLQKLSIRCNRILCVCHMVNVAGIKEALRQPPAILKTFENIEYSSEIKSPTTSTLLQHLDDYPKVVEKYWIIRKDKKPEALYSFDKMSTVIHEIIECSYDPEKNWNWSLRNHQALKRMIKGLLKEKRECSIPMKECLPIVESCYNRNFTEAVRTHLLTFSDGSLLKEDVAHAHQQADSEDAIDDPPLDSDTKNPIVYVRSCSNLPGYNQFIENKDLSFNPQFLWSDYIKHHNDMRRRVLDVDKNMSLLPSSEKYRGSMERGLDVRRIMRASYKKDPSLFVLRHKKTHLPSPTANEIIPMIWFFTSTHLLLNSKKVIRIWNNHEIGAKEFTKNYLLGQKWTRTSHIYASHKFNKDKLRIKVNRLSLMVSFTDFGLTPLELKKQYGDSIRRLFKDGKDIEGSYTEIFEKIIGCATSRVYCIIKSDDSIPEQIINCAKKERKQVITLSHTDVGTADIERLSNNISIDSWGKPKTRKNTIDAEKKYKEMVNRFWW